MHERPETRNRTRSARPERQTLKSPIARLHAREQRLAAAESGRQALASTTSSAPELRRMTASAAARKTKSATKTTVALLRKTIRTPMPKVKVRLNGMKESRRRRPHHHLIIVTRNQLTSATSSVFALAERNSHWFVSTLASMRLS